MDDHLKFLAFKESQFAVLKNEQDAATVYLLKEQSWTDPE